MQETPLSVSTPSPAATIPTPKPLIIEQPISYFYEIFPGYNSPPTTIQPPVQDEKLETCLSSTRGMMLLHYYTVSTFVTLTSYSQFERLWQIEIPKLSFSNPFLLHGCRSTKPGSPVTSNIIPLVLGLSACHLSYLETKGTGEHEQYNNAAKHHYTTALSLFRPMLNEINEDNATPIVAFSMLVIILSMGMPPVAVPEPPTPSSYVNYIINMLRLVRGVKDVLDQAHPMIQTSIIEPMLHVDREAGKEALGFEAEVAMRCIEDRIRRDISDPSLREEYLEAAKRLRGSNPRRPYKGMEYQSIVLAWPAMIPLSLFCEMDEGKPISMAILTFFGVLLHNLQDIWWAGDKGKKLVEAAADMLPKGWESVVVWAKMTVGLPCDYTPLS